MHASIALKNNPAAKTGSGHTQVRLGKRRFTQTHAVDLNGGRRASAAGDRAATLVLRWAVAARQTSVRVVLVAFQAIRCRESVGVLAGTARAAVHVLTFQQLLHRGGKERAVLVNATPVVHAIYLSGQTVSRFFTIPDNGAEKRMHVFCSSRLHGTVDELACLDSIEALHAPYRTERPAGAAGALVLRGSDAARRLLAGLWAGPVDLGVHGWWVVMP